ncbi:hypothetical protein BDR26DRAFT_871967 [Obelidium mucronatum]|nr:hypothetical protein BDR26DRAFT_871967 [Obelidium mucronatum]
MSLPTAILGDLDGGPGEPIRPTTMLPATTVRATRTTAVVTVALPSPPPPLSPSPSPSPIIDPATTADSVKTTVITDPVPASRSPDIGDQTSTLERTQTASTNTNLSSSSTSEAMTATSSIETSTSWSVSLHSTTTETVSTISSKTLPAVAGSGANGGSVVIQSLPQPPQPPAPITTPTSFPNLNESSSSTTSVRRQFLEHSDKERGQVSAQLSLAHGGDGGVVEDPFLIADERALFTEKGPRGNPKRRSTWNPLDQDGLGGAAYTPSESDKPMWFEGDTTLANIAYEQSLVSRGSPPQVSGPALQIQHRSTSGSAQAAYSPVMPPTALSESISSRVAKRFLAAGASIGGVGGRAGASQGIVIERAEEEKRVPEEAQAQYSGLLSVPLEAEAELRLSTAERIRSKKQVIMSRMSIYSEDSEKTGTMRSHRTDVSDVNSIVSGLSSRVGNGSGIDSEDEI